MAIVRGIFRDPPNDIMQALSRGSLFADVLQANWRNQLNLYKIVSFYEKEDEHHVGDDHVVLLTIPGLNIAGPYCAQSVCCNWSSWRHGEPGWY